MKNLKNLKDIKQKEFALLFLFISLTLTGLFLFLTNQDAYRVYLKEDGFIEYITFFLLLSTAVNCFTKGLKAPEKSHPFFISSWPLFSFLVEEKKYLGGQRIFNFDTPESLESINTQGEFTFHNTKLYGIKLNKRLFGTALYGAVFDYFLLFPILFKRNRPFRTWMNSYQFPIPKHIYSFLYFFSFFLILLIIPDGFRKWELQELVLSGYISLSFLYPQNSSVFNQEKEKSLTASKKAKPGYLGHIRATKKEVE